VAGRFPSATLAGVAGPAMNLVLATVTAVVLRILCLFGTPDTSIVMYICAFFMLFNLLLAFFNLIPIPPLDGSRVLQWFLSGPAFQAYNSIERYGFFILVALIFLLPMVNPNLDVISWPSASERYWPPRSACTRRWLESFMSTIKSELVRRPFDMATPPISRHRARSLVLRVDGVLHLVRRVPDLLFGRRVISPRRLRSSAPQCHDDSDDGHQHADDDGNKAGSVMPTKNQHANHEDDETDDRGDPVAGTLHFTSLSRTRGGGTPS
jgi:hypothetical protein